MRSSARFPFLSKLLAALARAAGRWARRRQGEDSLPLTLKPRRIYILPTRAGLIGALLLVLMLVAGLNYNNSLALLLCFLLSGVALVGMYEAQRVLAGMSLAAVQVEPTFAGRAGELTLHLENPDARARARLSLLCGAGRAHEFHLGAHEQRVVQINYPAERRGRHRLARVTLATDAPFGLFRAWCWLHLPVDTLVYPAPLGQHPLPPMRGARASGRHRSTQSGEEDWAWLRPFRAGDAPRSVAWKAYAHGGPLLVVHYETPIGAVRLLEYARLTELGVEQRLSQLTQWVLECERQGVDYTMALPGRLLNARQGHSQRRACLEALALFGS